jgi:hypothetical protein
MSNLYSTKQKLAIANSAIANHRGDKTNLDYKEQINGLKDMFGKL